METKQLSNPPIIEALIELRFSPSPDVTLQQLEDFCDQQSSKYPNRESVYAKSVEIAFNGEEHSSKADTYPNGFRLNNIDGTRCIVCAIDRVVVSIKPPYISWPGLRTMALDAYKAYSEKVSHGKLIRLGMRYINKVQIPTNDQVDLDDYIKTMPKMPIAEGIPEVLSNFETLTVIPFDDIPSATTTVRQVLLREGPDSTPLILDIDIASVSKDGIEDTEIQSLLDTFRDKKNKLFFASLTDKALEPYK